VAYKIFITYKYSDTSVKSLNTFFPTKVRDYVDEVQKLLAVEDHINKGELDGESLAQFEDETIASSLRNKIYDSSITVILVSPNMKNLLYPEQDQWMPWEISYSLKEHSRNGRTSGSNALLAVVLPDQLGNYGYYITENVCPTCNCRSLKTDFLFKIMQSNMFNIKKPNLTTCSNPAHSYATIYHGPSSYIPTVKWSDFILDINKHLEEALTINVNIEDYSITKNVS
jgi:MTH538 TIR-like domain (DUF1863)